MDLRGKTVVITGAGRGIGSAMATAFAAKGANLLLLDLNQDDLAVTEQTCSAAGVQVLTQRCNVAQEDEVSRALDVAVATFKSLDVMINNAGITRDALLVKVQDGEVVDKMSLAQWRAVIDVNLTGVFLCAREAATRMISLGNGGCIISISSISRAGNAGQTNYSAAKAGVASMTTVWAKELARHGIRAGAIAPGFTRTPIVDAMKPEILQRMVAATPLKRMAQPAEIAHAAIFIAENDFFSGRVLELDGAQRI